MGGRGWRLANLKPVRLDAGDIAAMRQQLQRSDLDDEQRLVEHRRTRRDGSFRVEHERAAVEHDFVLPAAQVLYLIHISEPTSPH